jgi:hypothetical protein
MATRRNWLCALALVLSVAACSSSSKTTTPTTVADNGARQAQSRARQDLVDAISSWNKYCGVVRCADDAPANLPNVLVARARAFRPYAEDERRDVAIAITNATAVRKFDGCTAVSQKCVDALNRLSESLTRLIGDLYAGD